jgi:hypothetical protein
LNDIGAGQLQSRAGSHPLGLIAWAIIGR